MAPWFWSPLYLSTFTFDKSQILKSGDITFQQFLEECSKYESAIIDEQMRMLNAEEYLEWIEKFMEADLKSMKKVEKYDFKSYESFSSIYSDLKTKSKEEDLVYITSGYTRKFSKKEGDFKIGGITLSWNSDSKKMVPMLGWILKQQKTLKEVGYFNFVQGFDMNYCGVIIGRDLFLNENNELDINIKYVINKYDKAMKKIMIFI